MKKVLNNPKRRIIFAVMIFIIMAGALAVFFIWGTRGNNVSVGGLRVFHFNPGEGRFEGTAVNVPSSSRDLQVQTLINHYYSPPRNTALTGLWPEGLGVISVVYRGDLVGISFPREYREMTSLEESLFRAGLVLTLTELPFVERVLIWVDGEGDKPLMPFEKWLSIWVDETEEENEEWWWDPSAVTIETASTVTNDPSLSPGVMASRVITLYFVCADGEGLITETFVDDYIDLHRLAETKLLYLIAGPSLENEKAMRVIPPETRIRIINYEPESRSLYVDFSGDFMNRFIGNAHISRLMLQSIVNTLTSTDNTDWTSRVERVFFLIDSQRHEIFHGVTDFNLGFVYGHDMTLVDEEPEYDPHVEDEDDEVPVGPRGDDDE
ncbi:MAG: GerMN domain-containing protein [Defluviitaleaceae bacterium]|nr:GerMN domain-containing protein [Defluviitaleaceae bacterium]